MSNKLASLDALTRFWTNTKTYIQKYVSSFVNNKLSNFIQKSDIINNFTSTDATKVAAAPTVKSLNDSINQLNMNLVPQGTFTGIWYYCFYIKGMGLCVPISKKMGDTSLVITSARIFTDSGWHDTNVLNIAESINSWKIALNDEGFIDLVNGNCYLVELSGNIT